jgi:spermidine/putrescine transport system ATP-binding protein
MKQRESIISIENVTHAFGDKTVLKNVSLQVSKGEFVTILGPSGCGKTTLMRIIGGFQKTKHGKITIQGEDMTAIPPHLRPVNTVFQRYALFPHLNVFNNVAFGLQLKKLPKEDVEKKVKQVLKMVSMTDYEERNVDSLSGGQQQRIAIARAIVNEPQVLLLDEPLAALDLKMRKDMQMEIKAMHQKLGITFVYITHDQEEALTLSDRIVVMSEGVIQQIGKPTEIYNEPANSFVADFIGESNILNGIMIEDSLVEFAGHRFECVDKGFGQNVPVDVVVRPEDIYIFDLSDKAQFIGTVSSCIFKGVHYEMMVTTPEGYEFLIQDYHSYDTGKNVGMLIKPFDIHVMKKERLFNIFDATITDKTQMKLFGENFVCIEAEAYETGAEVQVQVSFSDILLKDNEEEGILQGSVKYILYKGDHYHLTILTDDNQHIFADTNDIWDEGDRVGVSIVPETVHIVQS